MSKQEFLQRLRETLLGEVSGNIIEENIRFYDDYISTEVRKGTSEEEVIASIGDPRLIAKTIMEANENARESGKTRRTFFESGSGNRQTFDEDSQNSNPNMHYINFSKWYWKLLGIVVVVLFFFIVASILTGLFTLLMPLLGPLLILFLIYWIIKRIR